VPPGLDWDRFLGPAQWKPYSKNKFAYNWHWFWDTGNGDIGNQGVHQMDICAWGLGRTGWPLSVSSSGGKFVWKDDQETPNTQQSTLDFGDAQITFDVRNLPGGRVLIRRERVHAVSHAPRRDGEHTAQLPAPEHADGGSRKNRLDHASSSERTLAACSSRNARSLSRNAGS
jgi:hypothetical protein